MWMLMVGNVCVYVLHEYMLHVYVAWMCMLNKRRSCLFHDNGILPHPQPLLHSHHPHHNTGHPGGPFKDGGVIDRIGLTGWRTRRRQQGRGMASTIAPPPAVVHLIRRSSPFSGADDVEATGERRVTVVRSPKSGVSLWSLGDVGGQFEAARERAVPAAYAVMERQGTKEAAT